MIYKPGISSILEFLFVFVPVLINVAYITICERKTLASMQRRLGPNVVGYYGLLQPFADALKLLLKENISPTQANSILFFLGPIITLNFSLLTYVIIPYGPGNCLLDFSLGILYVLAISSLSTYGILIAGWSANSKYAFLGSLRSTAQLISYELVLSSVILVVILLTGSLNFTSILENQKEILFFLPLIPLLYIFFIGAIAETNRAPFDLAEAESELVSGFMTEHAAVIFVFFFLGEYASIAFICILTVLLFIGGYLYTTDYLYNPYLYYFYYLDYDLFDKTYLKSSLLLIFVYFGLILSAKTILFIFSFIWARASYPRIRYDQLMSECWTVLLPLVLGFIMLVPFIIVFYDTITTQIMLL